MNISALCEAIIAVCPLDHVESDPTGAIVRVVYGSGATSAQLTAGEAVVSGWVDPPANPSCDTKRLVQAMQNAGTLPAFIVAFNASKATDQHRWLKYDAVSQNNPPFCRICAAASPPIDPVATMTAALLLP